MLGLVLRFRSLDGRMVRKSLRQCNCAVGEEEEVVVVVL